jgi:A/G-specific adenine glycosylase
MALRKGGAKVAPGPQGGFDFAAAAADLGNWFKAHRRDLPWRAAVSEAAAAKSAAAKASIAEGAVAEAGSPYRAGRPGGTTLRDPYAVWISEIMLQQTQVATVIEYFTRWMVRFPDVDGLARAAEPEVLELWAGLGYYSRARNILATARVVSEDLGGVFPRRREDLLGLKGIGEYTAGAICSLAFNQPEPILDGNLIRVFSRLYGLDYRPEAAAERETYWSLARAWAGSARPAETNEALMELGALVCTPKGPSCGRCPLAERCRAKAEGRQESLPPPKARKAGLEVRGIALVATRGGEVLLHRPSKGELLAGLLTFPVFPGADVPALRKAWRGRLPGMPVPAFLPRSVTVTHAITHHNFRLKIAGARLETDADAGRLPEGFAWVAAAEVERALVSSLPKKIWKAFAR